MKQSIAAGLILLLAGCTAPQSSQDSQESSRASASASSSAAFSSATLPHSSLASASSPSAASGAFLPPLADAAGRVSKKPFGIYVTPSSSPVSPERFTGYHTGEDFETFPNERSADVRISAICAGSVRFTGWVKGYGGVLIQQCSYRGQPVTVLYGHLNVDAIAPRPGSKLAAGALVGLLGTGYSVQTDGERKHLHLAVHKGTALEFRGYVATREVLDQWINPFPY